MIREISSPIPRRLVSRVAALAAPTPTMANCKRSTWLLALLPLWVAMGCDGDNGTGASSVASVTVTSAKDTILVRSTTSQLTATAKDGSGNTVTNAAFTWESSNPTVVSVSATGLASGQSEGNAVLTARTQGRTDPVTGSIPIRVVTNNIATVSALASDAFAATLVTAVTAGTRSAVQAAWAPCAAGAAAENVVTIRNCVVAMRQIADTDPTDRVLISVLLLYVNRIAGLLSL